MTASETLFMPQMVAVPRRSAIRVGGVFALWASSLWIYLLPARAGRLWTKAPVWWASLVFATNGVLAVGWSWVLSVCVHCWWVNLLRLHHSPIEGYVDHPVREFFDDFRLVRVEILKYWSQQEIANQVAAVVGIGSVILLFLAFLFFLLLPFAARPGPNKQCAMHVVRSVLMASGASHLFFPALSAYMLLMIAGKYQDFENIVGGLLAVLMIIGVWTLFSLVRAAQQEYRALADMPKPHDPWCEECGYNLCMTSPTGRCPECGTPVEESTGSSQRLPLPLESELRFTTVIPFILRHLEAMITHPRRLFFQMPTLQGQVPAQWWMVASLFLLGGLASLILPTFKICGLLKEAEWDGTLLASSLAVGLAWALFGLMMVGIETAGITVFSRMRAKERDGPEGLYFAAGAKVTCYSSILMLPWVVLGGAQLLLYQYWETFPHPFRIPMRSESVLLAISLAVAHIGGLLWYELTVYRGVRAIQYANK